MENSFTMTIENKSVTVMKMLNKNVSSFVAEKTLGMNEVCVEAMKITLETEGAFRRRGSELLRS